ncbi:type II asparaginase [Solitalea canadensis]|uniref:L-asparaginase type II family protein n=1 Tax=Solitalea canadensis (strain ATCC 29591 / DSM 3403 / JCM 21819 / LMG 8368 / NBRC 15130 / NCIMB 12057 / USAM 9D) TaxID=929556 RepID=H8KMH1_SOLCM|nr:type II asparaginase [Solitalea canadensis]AFD08766.1 L-asparaginase type II family protein [Solitalea canadensis DSM 3403]
MKRSLTNFFLLLVTVTFTTVAYAQNTRVKILATGGTIAGAGAAADRAAYTAGKLPIDELLNAVPQIHKIAKITGEQVASIGSQDMSIEVWLKLAKRINEIFAKNEADAIVITHGTDTQEETAYFLDLAVKYDKPVILVGAMRPATAISADGPKNLLDAVVVAADPKSQGRGVMLAMNERVFDARSVTKTNSTALETFLSTNFGPVGLIYDQKVEYYYNPVRKGNKDTPFDVNSTTSLPRVDVAYMYADADPTALNAFVAAGAKGIIFTGVGNGNMNKKNYDAIKAATDKGVIVVRATRTPGGRVTLHDEVDDAALGTIVSDDLNAQKARILLMLALTKTSDKAKLQDIFFQY